MKTRIITTLAMTLLAGGLTAAADSKSENTASEKTEAKQVSPATQKLIEAVKNGEYWNYEDCIKEGADVNASIDDRDTILSKELDRAFWRGKYDGAKILIKNGADINHIFTLSTLSFSGTCPLWEIALGEQYPPHKNNLESFFDWLIKEGIELKPVGVRKSTPLHIAASRGYHGLVMTLMIHGAKINGRNAEGKTPLDLNVHVLCNLLDMAERWDGTMTSNRGRQITLKEYRELAQSMFTTLEVLMISGADPNLWHEETVWDSDKKIQVNAITRIMRTFNFNLNNYPIVLKEVYKKRKPYHLDKNGLNLFENYLLQNVSEKTISGNKITTSFNVRFFLGLFISDGVRISNPKALELLKKDGELYYDYKKKQGIK